MAGLQAGKKGQKKAGKGQEALSFTVAMIAQMASSHVAKGKHAAAAEAQSGLPASGPGPVERAGELLQPTGAEGPERPAALPGGPQEQDADLTAMQGQVPARAGARDERLSDAGQSASESGPGAAAQADPRASGLPVQAVPNQSATVLEGQGGEAPQDGGVRAYSPTPLARAIEVVADTQARAMPEPAAVERDRIAPRLPLEQVADAGKGDRDGAKPVPAVPANAADAAGRGGQVLPTRMDAALQNHPQAFQEFQDPSGDGAGDAFSMNVPATPASGTDPALVRPFDQVLRQVEARVNVAVEAQVRTPAFATELGEKVVWLAGRSAQVAELTLNPPQMGTLEVRLTLTGGEAGAQFFSPNPVVREALEAALPRLRELMAQAGINLGQADVRDQALSQDRAAGQPPGRATASVQGAEVALDAAILGSHRSSGVGLVDLYA